MQKGGRRVEAEFAGLTSKRQNARRQADMTPAGTGCSLWPLAFALSPFAVFRFSPEEAGTGTDELGMTPTKKVFFPWKPDYSVHHPDIDRQHQRLAALVNEVHVAMAEGKGRLAVDHVLTELVDYTKRSTKSCITSFCSRLESTSRSGPSSSRSMLWSSQVS